jgi:hypothetical protein
VICPSLDHALDTLPALGKGSVRTRAVGNLVRMEQHPWSDRLGHMAFASALAAELEDSSLPAVVDTSVSALAVPQE